jgi:hypothetical protein
VRQEINLYQPVSDAQLMRLSAATAGWMLGVLCVVLSLWRLYDGRQVAQLERDVQSARAQQQRQSDMARADGVARVARDDTANLQAKALQLAARVRERQHALELIDGGAAGAPGGFAGRLEVFARRRVEGVWLDHIVLEGQGGIKILAGHTLDPNLVPRYFEGLAGEPAMRGTQFQEFRIEVPRESERGTSCAVDLQRAPNAAAAPLPDDPQMRAGSTGFCASNAPTSSPQAGGSS